MKPLGSPYDVRTEALVRELSQIIQKDRYRLSHRIVTLKEIMWQLRPKPAREGITSRRARGDMGDDGKLVNAPLVHANCP